MVNKYETSVLKKHAQQESGKCIMAAIEEFQVMLNTDREPTDLELEWFHAGYKAGAMVVIEEVADDSQVRD